MRPRKTPRDTASTLPLSPRYAGKRSSPQPGGPIHISSTHLSTEAGQLHRRQHRSLVHGERATSALVNMTTTA